MLSSFLQLHIRNPSWYISDLMNTTSEVASVKLTLLRTAQSPEFDTEQAVERRLLAELARQQHQSEEDRRWLQMQEDNLVRA